MCLCSKEKYFVKYAPTIDRKCFLKNKLNPFGSIYVTKYLNLYRLSIERAVEAGTWGDRDAFDIHYRQRNTEIYDKFKLRDTFQWDVICVYETLKYHEHRNKNKREILSM